MKLLIPGWILMLSLTSCTEPSGKERGGRSAADAGPAGFFMDPAVPVTWEGDVLPFLESTKSGEKYQCTVCHSEFSDPDTLLKDGQIDRIIASLRGEGAAFMPRIGDRVPDRYIVMLKRWEREAAGHKPVAE